MTTLYIVAAGLLCIAACVFGWAQARQRRRSRGWWTVLALAGALLLGRELLPDSRPATVSAAPPTVEEQIRRAADDSARLNEETDSLLREVRASWLARPSRTTTTPP